ncbi:THO complex subunit 2, partial [Nowakowskiella sp. JEL0078]
MAIGSRLHASKIINRLPYLISLDPEISDHMCRMLHVMLEPIYSIIRPLAGLTPNTTRSFAAASEVLAPPSNTLNHKFCQIFERVAIGGKRLHYPKWKFFYEPWKDELPEIRDCDALLKQLRQSLLFVGPHLHRDIVLLVKLIRIGRSHLNEVKSKDSQTISATRDSWVTVIAKYIFPAVSQIYSNPGIAQELWELIKLFPYQMRYGMYGEWKNEAYKIPELSLAGAECRSDTKYIMRRISKENVKIFGRRIGKLVHSNPTIVFSIILETIQSYDNQIPFIVDASRYLTDLEFDVLSFCLIEALSNPAKARLKDDGMSAPKWITALSNFTGTLCRKHTFELSGLLQYIANKLVLDQLYDLVVLQDIIGNMTGVRNLEEVTENEVEALAGGETLRREALKLESTRTTRKPSMRLLAALTEGGLEKVLGVLIAQQRRDCVFRENFSDVKVLGSVLDHVMDKEEYAKRFRSVRELCIEFGVEPEIAFHMLRPTLMYLVQKNSGMNSNLVMKNVENTKQANGSSGNPSEVEDNKMDVDETIITESGIWNPGLHDTIAEVVPLLPDTVWKCISPEFYVTFWQLSLSDIYVPGPRYRLEVTRQQSLIQQLDLEAKMGSSSDGMVNTAANVNKRRKEKERINIMISLLNREWKEQEENHAGVMERLEKEKMMWFAIQHSRKDIITYFMQYCLFPRCLISTADATYCAKMIHILHKMGTPNFSSLSLCDRILKKENIHASIISSSENEARNY